MKYYFALLFCFFLVLGCKTTKLDSKAPDYYYSDPCKLHFVLNDGSYQLISDGITQSIICSGDFKSIGDSIYFHNTLQRTIANSSSGEFAFCQPNEIGELRGDTLIYKSCAFIIRK